MYRIVFAYVTAFALAAVMAVLSAAPASAQCSSCRSSSRTPARRYYVQATRPQATGALQGEGLVRVATQPVGHQRIMGQVHKTGRGTEVKVSTRAIAGSIEFMTGPIAQLSEGDTVQIVLSKFDWEPVPPHRSEQALNGRPLPQVQPEPLGHHQPTQAQVQATQEAAGERGRVGGRVLRGGGKVVKRIGKGLGRVLPPYK